MDDINKAKGRTAQRAENSYASDGPQDEFEVEVIRDVCGTEGFADGHGQDGVGDHPRDDHVSADGAVVVFLLLRVADAVFGRFEPVSEVSQGFVVARVDVELFGGHF